MKTEGVRVDQYMPDEHRSQLACTKSQTENFSDVIDCQKTQVRKSSRRRRMIGDGEVQKLCSAGLGR